MKIKKTIILTFIMIILLSFCSFAIDYVNISETIISEDFIYSDAYSNHGWSWFLPASNTPDHPVESPFGGGGFGNNGSGSGASNSEGARIYRSFTSQAIQPHESLIMVFHVFSNSTNTPAPAYTIWFGNESGVTAGSSSIRAEIIDAEDGNDRIYLDFSNAPFDSAVSSNCDISSKLTKTGDLDKDNYSVSIEVALMLDLGRLEYWVYVDQLATNCNGVSMGTLTNSDYELNSLSIATPYYENGQSLYIDTVLDNITLGKGYLSGVGASGVSAGISDLSVSVSSIWDDMGLQSTESKVMTGLFLMVFLALVLWGLTIKSGSHLSPIALVVIEFFFLIFLSYIGLMPRWIPYVLGLLAVGGVIYTVHQGARK